MKHRHLSPVVAGLALALAAIAAPSDPLTAGFLNPPESAKPQTWWHWMNGNITKAGITADLEAMKQIGLGGATIVNVDNGIPRGTVPFMSDEWRNDFKFAVQEAHRLGLELTVENCAGWSSSGGPWNTPENSMQRVVTSELQLAGPRRFSGSLPLPPTKLGFYRDIAVLAFPVSRCMRDFSPLASVSGIPLDAGNLVDGDNRTLLELPVPTAKNPSWAQLEFPQAFAARTVRIVGGSDLPICRGEILVSDDGRTFRALKSFAFEKYVHSSQLVALGPQPVTARFWRVRFQPDPKAPRATIPLAEIELLDQTGIDNIIGKAGAEGRRQTAVLSAPDAGELTDGAIRRRDLIDLTAQLQPDGKLNWSVPAGRWTVLRFGHTSTGIENHPPPAEGEGLECDKMSKRALDLHWAGFMQKVLDDVGPLAGKTLGTSLIDSYEVGGQNWTEDFAREFQRRRGYDLRPFLPALTGLVVDNPAVSERFLWDLRRTIADLIAENYFGHFAELCHAHGLLNAVEPYTGPFESMQSGAPADIVMGEFWTGSKGHSSIKLVSSIAHIYGKTIVGAESFTAMPGIGRWRNDPYELKPLGDLMFCQGLNRYIFHRYAMQPWTNRWPGMTMGQWGFHFERTNTWWNQGKSWINYISRCEFLLQQGRAVADAAYFTGESAPVEFRAGDPALPPGYDYDAVNADVLLNGASVKNGRLTLASGANYAALILPPTDANMTPTLLQRMADLVRAGATVVGPRPRHSPSLSDYPGCDARVEKLAAEVWGPCDGHSVLAHAYGRGRVSWGQSLADIFAAQKLSPDFEYRGASASSRLAYAHRTADGAEIYFISNQQRESDQVECTFRVSGMRPELWYPDTGVITPAPVWNEKNGRTAVRLTFDPAGSVFVIFRNTTAGDHVVKAKMDAQWEIAVDAGGRLLVKAASDGVAEFQTTAGEILQAAAANIPAPLALDGEWTVRFPPHWGAPPAITLEKLISWTNHADAGVRYFSGTAVYEKDITIPADRLSSERELWLDLGAVKNFAEVSLNGHDLGVLWKPPFRVNVTSAAKPGVNKLQIKVTNLWPNRLIGDEQLPPDCEWIGKQLKKWPQWLLEGKPSPTGRLTFTTWHHWTKDSPLLESGLLGPVMLRTAELIPLK